MPRGEHFKKDNPRINQVSFKVNDIELKELQGLARKKGVAVATWLRDQINFDQEQKIVREDPEEAIEMESKVLLKSSKADQLVKKDVVNSPKIEKLEEDKKTRPKNSVQNEQMSLF
jgi:hypothetical protein